jgi:hypothetical protein
MFRSLPGVEEPLAFASRQMHSEEKCIFGLAIKPDKGVWEGSHSGSVRDVRQFSQGTVAWRARRKNGKSNNPILLAFRMVQTSLLRFDIEQRCTLECLLAFRIAAAFFFAAAFTLATCMISSSPPNSHQAVSLGPVGNVREAVIMLQVLQTGGLHLSRHLKPFRVSALRLWRLRSPS